MLRNLIGRKDEIRRLDSCMRETNAQLIILYGRRRIGKTYLIDEYFHGRFDFKITGSYKEKKDLQLYNFAEELSGHTGKTVRTPESWAEAFQLLRRYISTLPEQEKCVLFFDEFPWLDTAHSGFLNAFSHFWNDYGCARHNMICIVCGCATSWIVENILENKGGLFDRQTCSICLQPFNLSQTEEYLRSRGIEWSRYDLAECYMIMGGIPYYLSLLRPERSLSDNIDNLFFRKRSELWNEFQQLYRTLFTNSDPYIQIVEALSIRRSGMTRNEIIEKTGLSDNGAFSEKLRDLIASGFVGVTSQFGKKKEVYYQLRDYYTWFYLRFIKGQNGLDEHFWTHSTGAPTRYVWAGLMFEMVCKDHIPQIKHRIGISGVLTEESTWSVRGNENEDGAQVDLVIDRKDHVIDLCEIKYSEREYAIDKDYDVKLRSRRESFREHTKTKKTVQIIFISTYGLKQNKYSGLVSGQVVLDDLFVQTE
ncbi:MAG: AAA family ATPase [Clostridia bacterium]|nr:AAA family ATPase [Clostridia bacterium]